LRGIRILGLLHLLTVATVYPAAAQQSTPLELSRPVHTWEFLPAVGRRAALLGNEAGTFEAWVYPLKIFRDFHLQFLTDGEVIPAAALARTVIVRPESATITYSGDTFSVHETLIVPVDEPGAVILIDVQTSTPLEVEAVFRRDFQLEWPGSLGGAYLDWDYRMQAFYFGEGQEHFAASLGSPTGRQPRLEYETNFFSSDENSLRLGPTTKGHETKAIVLAASVNGRGDAARIYRRISEDYSNLLQRAGDYYRDFLARTVQLALPDQQIQEAYDWARVSVLQGFVTNPFLGTGLVAGYRISGDDERPGFAWFFGRDALWTSLALD
jgi:glycogen debranching enzyme